MTNERFSDVWCGWSLERCYEVQKFAFLKHDHNPVRMPWQEEEEDDEP